MLKEVSGEFSATFETKKSKFIAHICPYNQFDNILIRLKKEHTKAKHFVYAYQYINEFEQIVENSSDDGEPKGTSGRPSLNVLIGAGVINTAIITIRYFGGIKLGTGGLVKAYSDAVNKIIDISDFIVRLGYRKKKYLGGVGYNWIYLIYAKTEFSSEYSSLSASASGFGVGKRWFSAYWFSAIEMVFSFSLDFVLYTDYDVSPRANYEVSDSSRMTFLMLNNIY